MKNVLKSLFESLLRSRRMRHHFERWQTLLGSKSAGAAPAAMPPDIAKALAAASRTDAGEMLSSLHSSPQGLAESQAQALRQRLGSNEVRHEQPLPWWVHLWQCYRNPFNLLLTVLALVSYVTEDMKAALVIGSMVVLSTVLRFVQESRSSKAAERLKAMVSNTATVLRPVPSQEVGGEGFGTTHAGTVRVEVPMRDLVPGDVIALSAGDMIPADCRLLNAKDLFISQSALTGEAMPVEKFSIDRGSDEAGVLERENLLFMGTNVISGTATALIVHTGSRTFFGALAQRVTAADQGTSAFQAGINRVSWVLIRFMLVMAPLVLVINGVAKGDWWEAALFALSIAVGLTPEMLPMIVTATLAKGAVVMSRQKVIVKRLEAIHNFGAMDVLCTDKTGTLTQDRIVLERHANAWGETSDHVLQMAYLNSFHQTGLKNLLDKAVLSHAEMQPETRLQTAWRKIDEVPFDFSRRRMSVVVENGGGEHLLICKGALEEILSACTSVERGDEVLPLDAGLLARIHGIASELNTQGLRVVAVASRVVARGAQSPAHLAYSLADESALTLLGYVAFLDPPKESTAPALRALAEHGVAVKVLTGDNELVARKVCGDVGIEAGHVVLGREIEAMDDAGLRALVERHQVFAKLTPAHKERIVRALHANGHVVGFMGDGINDAPALRAADIGISVDGAVDVAKESADIILLEKSLMVLEQGVVEGRRTFANMLKYIKLTASSNFGNVFSVLVASAFLPFLPMLPLHLLVQNLLYDVSQIAIPFDNVDAEFLRKPQSWNPADLGRFMLFFGPLSSVFDILTYAVMWFVFSANTVAHQTLFQSGWFVEGLLSQTLIVHLIRTRKIPFLQSRAAWPLLAMGAAIAAAGIWLPMGRLAHYFRLQALPLAYFPWLAAMLAGYATLTQTVKGWYARRYGWQ